MNPSIPFFSIETVQKNLDLQTPIQRVLNSHWYILGKEVEAFEHEFATYIGVQHCISLANGTDALELGLRALDIQRNDKVLVVANAGFYSSAAVHLIGAIPYYVEIDPLTLLMSTEHLQTALAIKPKVIIVTHLYGQLANMQDICNLAEKAGVPIIEDCAQAHGAMRHGKRAGSFGKIACFSFYPTKNLGALGDGGAIVTDDLDLAIKIKQLRQYGWKSKYHVDIPGGRNSRLDEIQAAILREKLPKLDENNQQRRKIAQQYNAAFSSLPIQCPSSLAEDYVAHLYVIRIENRNAFCDYLKKHGIPSDIHYPIPDHSQNAYLAEQKKGMLPITEQACMQVVSLPCYPGLNETQVQSIILVVQNYFKNVSI